MAQGKRTEDRVEVGRDGLRDMLRLLHPQLVSPEEAVTRNAKLRLVWRAVAAHPDLDSPWLDDVPSDGAPGGSLGCVPAGPSGRILAGSPGCVPAGPSGRFLAGASGCIPGGPSGRIPEDPAGRLPDGLQGGLSNGRRTGRPRGLRYGCRQPHPNCPHCGGSEVIGWGRRFRQMRYRCRTCGRTFTSTTGTPQAGLRYQDKWPEMGRCLVEGLSVRRSAVRLGVHPSTAFRWRHRLLGSLAQRPKPVLGGIVEVVETYYPDCHKGERNLSRPARRRGERYRFLLRQNGVCVVLAADRTGRGLAEMACFGVPRRGSLGEVFCPALVRGSVVCTEPLRWYKDFFGRADVKHRQVRDFSHGWAMELVKRGWWWPDPTVEPHNINRVAAVRWRLKGWLPRFRGVAVKYLPGYLAWFRFTEETAGLESAEANEALWTEVRSG